MKALVTGGAGYVGSHICKALAQAGFEPVVFDNFSNGHRAFVKWGPLVEGDIRDGDALDRAMAAPGDPVSLDDLKIIVLMVYWSFGEEPDALVLDELCDDADRVAH